MGGEKREFHNIEGRREGQERGQLSFLETTGEEEGREPTSANITKISRDSNYHNDTDSEEERMRGNERKKEMK